MTYTWYYKMTLLLSNTIYITQLQIRHYLFLQPLLHYHFYYLLLTNLTTTLHLPYTYIYIWHIFSTHYPLYISPIYTMCIAHFPHMQFPLMQLLYTYYHKYYLDYLFILKNVLFTILILLYFVNNTDTLLRTM